MSNNNEKISYVETIIQKILENNSFQMSDAEGEKFIKEYLELSRTVDIDPVTRMRFVIICINEIPTLVYKSRGLITAEELNKEIDIYVSSLDPQTKISFIQMLLKDGEGAIYSRDVAEMMDNFSKAINDTSTNWHTVCEHVEGIGQELGLVKPEETENSHSQQQYESQANAQSYREPTTSEFHSESKSSGGCYVATAVYGSYDCPQVWTLRRYRDNKLATTWYGRAFIHLYYAVSPTLVSCFGDKSWFNHFWKSKLDSIVAALKERGYDSTPYSDKNI